MIPGWIVVREEKHVDNRYWICTELKDALYIAKDVSDYWLEFYGGLNEEDLDITCYGDLEYSVNAEDTFWVYVHSVDIRFSGETKQKEKAPR